MPPVPWCWCSVAPAQGWFLWDNNGSIQRGWWNSGMCPSHWSKKKRGSGNIDIDGGYIVKEGEIMIHTYIWANYINYNAPTWKILKCFEDLIFRRLEKGKKNNPQMMGFMVIYLGKSTKMILNKSNTLQGINISYLGKRKIIFKMPFLGDMLVPWRVIENFPY